MDEFVSNSHKSKEDAKRPEKFSKVISGKATIRKKNDVQKLAESFFPEDISSVKDYILSDVIIPSLKKGIVDVITMLLYGETSQAKSSGIASKISYRSYYDSPRKSETRASGLTKRSIADYENIVFDTKGEAEVVVDCMQDILSRFGIVRVADMYELAGVSYQGYYTYNDYGWTDISNAHVVRIPDGYVIKMPRATQIR